MSTDFCKTNINSECLSKSIPKRNNYFSGKHISAEDLTLEQKYFIDKIKRINSEVTGYGIVNGLTIAQFNSSKKTIDINPGIGIDGCGNFLALYKQKSFSLPQELHDGDYLYLKYVEKGDNRVATGDDTTCSEECCFNHIVEDMEIHIDRELLALEANEICTEKMLFKEFKLPRKSRLTRIDNRLKLFKRTPPLLFLGRYIQRTKRGVIDTSDRVYLHTNAELSKLLCRIEENHVSSLNGQHGDLTAVSSINNAKPDSTGALEIVAGNNISVTSEENKIEISTKNGFHAEYILNLKANTQHEISHARGSFPIVDIYKRIPDASNKMTAFFMPELRREARDVNMELETYLEMKGAKRLSETVDKFYNGTPRDTRAVVSDQSKIYRSSKTTTKGVLDKFNAFEYSPKVAGTLYGEIRYSYDDLVLMPKYSYEKILGADSELKITVTHVDRNTIRLESLTTVPILVILNT